MSAFSKSLEKLRQLNEGSGLTSVFPQRIGAQEPTQSYPTLEKGVTRPLSPQLRERFAFASSWKHAANNQSWLAPSEAEKCWNKRSKLHKQVSLRAEHWPKSAVATTPLANVSLFAADTEQGDETYLIWGRRKEPEVVTYAGHTERRHRDLHTYVRALITGLESSSRSSELSDAREVIRSLEARLARRSKR